MKVFRLKLKRTIGDRQLFLKNIQRYCFYFHCRDLERASFPPLSQQWKMTNCEFPTFLEPIRKLKLQGDKLAQNRQKPGVHGERRIRSSHLCGAAVARHCSQEFSYNCSQIAGCWLWADGSVKPWENVDREKVRTHVKAPLTGLHWTSGFWGSTLRMQAWGRRTAARRGCTKSHSNPSLPFPLRAKAWSSRGNKTITFRALLQTHWCEKEGEKKTEKNKTTLFPWLRDRIRS